MAESAFCDRGPAVSRLTSPIEPSEKLNNVRYEIRGNLARRAHALELQGYEITSLNIGNPGLFGFRTPEKMRLAMIENLAASEPYSHEKGIFPAREAVVDTSRPRGRVTYEQRPTTRRRVYYQDPAPRRRASRQYDTFEEIFDDTPRYTRRRAARSRWDD